MHTLQRNNINWTAWILALIGIVWLSFVLIPCVHAVSSGLQNEHNCPHCPTPGKDPCHSNNNCNDCDTAKTTVKTQKLSIQQDDLPKLSALTQECHSAIANQPVFIKKYFSTQFFYNFPPIYLKNCAFLN